MMVLRCSIIVSYIIFFFSSRRRHTSWPRDWSSDVCSSDLVTTTSQRRRVVVVVTRRRWLAGGLLCGVGVLALRSEERRVGKERRSRWLRCAYKKICSRYVRISFALIRRACLQ